MTRGCAGVAGGSCLNGFVGAIDLLEKRMCRRADGFCFDGVVGAVDHLGLLLAATPMMSPSMV